MNDDTNILIENQDPDWTQVKAYAKLCVSSPHKDEEHYIFEAVMTALYGSDYWDLYNERNP